jgi:zinc/manganese transport system substrate-binding protein
MYLTRRQFVTVAAAGAAALKLPAKGQLKVIATTEDMASLAREVGGDRISVEALARGYQDPHFVEPKPSFIAKLHGADLLISVGLQLEAGCLR